MKILFLIGLWSSPVDDYLSKLFGERERECVVGEVGSKGKGKERVEQGKSIGL